MFHFRPLICAVLLLFGFEARGETPANILMVGMRLDDLVTLDPAEVYELSGGEIVANLYDRLVDSSGGSIAPDLAESWTVSRDGRQYVFTLKKNVKFHSGKTVTAEDVAWSFERSIKLDRGGAVILGQLGLTPQNAALRARAQGEHTFVLDLDDALAPGLVMNILGSFAASIVDSRQGRQLEKNGDYASTWFRTHDGGSGPFRLELWRPGQGVILSRFASHHLGTPAVERVALRHIAESSVQRLMLEKGDIDIARNLSPDDLGKLSSDRNIGILRVPQGGLYYVGMNLKTPSLANPKVRKALKYLIDYEGIAKNVLKGAMDVHQTILGKGFAGALDDKPYRLDVERAKRLLAEAGYANGLSLTLDARATPPSIDIAQTLAADFAKAGVRLEIMQMDNKQLLTRFRSRQHMLTLSLWSPDYPDPHATIQGFAWNPDNSDSSPFRLLAWRNAWSIPEITGEVQAAKSERDTEKRLGYYRHAQREALENGPYAMLFQDVQTLALRNGVKGLKIGITFDSMRYAEVRKGKAE